MDSYVETLYTENQLSVSAIMLLTNLTRTEVLAALRRLELID